MKKVLIIAYYFPPRLTVASLRPFGLAKYLPEFGWEPIVLTAQLPGKPDPRFQVIETNYYDCLGFAKKLLRLHSQAPLLAQVRTKVGIKSERSPLDYMLASIAGIIAYPDPQKGWRRFAVEAGRNLLRQQTIHAIVSSSPPQTSHLIAKRLKDEFGIPWVADLHDLWTQNYYYLYGPVRRIVERSLERNTLSAANTLVTVSDPFADRLRTLHRGSIVHSIPYGFDPDEVNASPARLTEKFTITYTGNIYPGKQTPELLFSALHSLIAEGSVHAADIEVRFYGPKAGWIDKLAERYGLAGLVCQFGLLSREVALDKQRESQLLLLLKWNDPKETGVYPAKVFEYLAARRPILAIGSFPDLIDGLLRQTGAGVSCRTDEEAKSVLLQSYQEFKSTGAVTYKGDDTEIGKYSHRQVAKTFAGILDDLTA